MLPRAPIRLMRRLGSTEVKTLSDMAPDSALGVQWEALVKASPESGIMQSLAWCEMKLRQGLHSVHLGVFEDDRLCGGAVFYTSRHQNGAGIMVAPEGPVIPWRDRARSVDYLRRLTAACQEYAALHGIVSMRVEPRVSAPPPPVFREFGRAPLDLVPRQTLYLDLHPGEDEQLILQGMKPKGRYNINLAQRNTVVVSEHHTPDVVPEFYTAVMQASVRDQFALEPQSFFETLAAVLCASGHATFLLAHHEGDLLGALLLITYGDRATYLYGGVTNEKRNFMGGYALQWAAIKCARARGCRTYDFYGYVPHRSPEHPYSRFSQFKSQFGGQAMTFMGAHDYIFLDNLADAFVRASREAFPAVASEAGP